MGKTDKVLKECIEEGIVALLPVYEEGGSATKIYTRKSEYTDPRSLRWILRQGAAYYGSELKVVRQQYAEHLQRRQNVPFPLSPHLILLPLKMREARVSGDTTIGYINAFEVEKALNEGEAPYRSAILFKGGLTLPCLNSFATLQERFLQGEAVKNEYLRRLKQDHNSSPVIEYERGREVLFTHCNCALKGILETLLLIAEKK